MGNKGIRKGSGSKVNVKARLEFEIAYYDNEVNQISHHVKGTPPNLSNTSLVVINHLIWY